MDSGNYFDIQLHGPRREGFRPVIMDPGDPAHLELIGPRLCMRSRHLEEHRSMIDRRKGKNSAGPCYVLDMAVIIAQSTDEHRSAGLRSKTCNVHKLTCRDREEERIV